MGEMAVGVSSGQNIGAPKCLDFLGHEARKIARYKIIEDVKKILP